jgi:hypothetical protein
MPVALQGFVAIKEGEKTQSVADQEEIKKLFPNTYGLPVISLVPGEKKAFPEMNVGVILSGGQAPGGHNVIAGLFDGLDAAQNAQAQQTVLKVFHSQFSALEFAVNERQKLSDEEMHSMVTAFSHALHDGE